MANPTYPNRQMQRSRLLNEGVGILKAPLIFQLVQEHLRSPWYSPYIPSTGAKVKYVSDPDTWHTYRGVSQYAMLELRDRTIFERIESILRNFIPRPGNVCVVAEWNVFADSVGIYPGVGESYRLVAEKLDLILPFYE